MLNKNLIIAETWDDFAAATEKLDYSQEDLVALCIQYNDIYYWLNIESIWGKIGFIWESQNTDKQGYGYFANSDLQFSQIPKVPDGHRILKMNSILKNKSGDVTLLQSDWSNMQEINLLSLSNSVTKFTSDFSNIPENCVFNMVDQSSTSGTFTPIEVYLKFARLNGTNRSLIAVPNLTAHKNNITLVVDDENQYLDFYLADNSALYNYVFDYRGSDKFNLKYFLQPINDSTNISLGILKIKDINSTYVIDSQYTNNNLRLIPADSSEIANIHNVLGSGTHPIYTGWSSINSTYEIANDNFIINQYMPFLVRDLTAGETIPEQDVNVTKNFVYNSSINSSLYNNCNFTINSQLPEIDCTGIEDLVLYKEGVINVSEGFDVRGIFIPYSNMMGTVTYRYQYPNLLLPTLTNIDSLKTLTILGTIKGYDPEAGTNNIYYPLSQSLVLDTLNVDNILFTGDFNITVKNYNKNFRVNRGCSLTTPLITVDFSETINFEPTAIYDSENDGRVVWGKYESRSVNFINCINVPDNLLVEHLKNSTIDTTVFGGIGAAYYIIEHPIYLYNTSYSAAYSRPTNFQMVYRSNVNLSAITLTQELLDELVNAVQDDNPPESGAGTITLNSETYALLTGEQNTYLLSKGYSVVEYIEN